MLMDVGFVHDAAGDILEMNDAVRPDRSQSFTYDPVSRLTRAVGGYGTLDYAYTLGGDREEKSLTAPDGIPVMTEIYDYDSATARLMQVNVDGAATRDFTYAPSGQMVSDLRPDSAIEVTLNARGRMASVTRDGAVVASFGHDVHQLRVSKTLSDGSVIHYHYDEQGRMIAETDGLTGETIRDYIWFGLSPIAVVEAGQASSVDRCSEEEMTRLRDLLATRQLTLATVSERVVRLTETLGLREATQADVQARRDLVAERLTTINPDNLDRIAELELRLTELEARLVELDGIVTDVANRLAEAQLREAELQEIVTRLSDTLSRREARCARLAAEGDGTDIVVTGEGVRLSYIHTDHLGRPAFVTSETGEVVWDGGITTPFGVSVSTVGAFTQNLMFPGQYRDAETGYDQNWNRTYDPKLGRYLQSDPIGLAGGLNRYAYVGGNPVSYVDPTGEVGLVGGLGGGAADLTLQLMMNGGRWECVNWAQVGLSAALGAIGVPAFAMRGFQFGKHSKSARNVNQRYRKYLEKRGRAPNSRYEIHHAHIPMRGRGPFGRLERAEESWRNHPMNLKALKIENHRRLETSWRGNPKYGPLRRWWYGTTEWSKTASIGLGAGLVAEAVDNDCGC